MVVGRVVVVMMLVVVVGRLVLGSCAVETEAGLHEFLQPAPTATAAPDS